MCEPVPLFVHKHGKCENSGSPLSNSQFPFQPSTHKWTLPFDLPAAVGSCSCLLEMAQHSTNFCLHSVCCATSHIDRQQQTASHSQWEPNLRLNAAKNALYQKKASNESCSEFNVVQKSQCAHISTSHRIGAGDSKDYHLWSNIMYFINMWELLSGLLFGSCPVLLHLFIWTFLE